MELDRRTWSSIVRLAAVFSVVAAVAAVAARVAGDVPQVAIVLTAIVLAFAASWIQTGRVRREPVSVRSPLPHQRSAA